MSTAARELAGERCSSCLDIHLSDYNLFLLKDYSGGRLIKGKVAAGGNITLDNFSVGEALPDDNVSNTLVAGGNLTLTAGSVHGATWYGGSYTPKWSVNIKRGPLTQGTPPDFVLRGFAERFTDLLALSSRLATQPVNGKTQRQKWGALDLTGTDPCLNVFEVTASDFNEVSARNINVPTGSFALVNIRGTASTPLKGGFNASINPRRVLYNFVDATRLEARDFGLLGTVLAPKADLVFNNGGWTGGIYAVSLNGNASGNLAPLDELAGKAEETCNEVDDDCNGQVDDGFECTGTATQSCTAWCGAAGTRSCDPATCGYGECVSSSCCRADADCGGGSYCEGTTCAVQKENGVECSSANQCASGQCVDGVCCNSACDGECDACDLAGLKGTCSMVSSEVKCRASGGDCDVAEYCTGAEAACPADAVVDAGTSCRAASGICDVAEVCDGSSKTCPLDGHIPNGTSCGTSTGDWGSCEGFSDYCDPTGTESRPVTASTCEAGTCTLSSTSTDTQACTRLPPGPQPCPADSESWGTCGGFSDTCDETGTRSHSKITYKYDCATGRCESTTVNDTVACTRSTAGVQCRTAADVCDVAETCSGGVCPADGKAPAGTSCNDNNTCTTSDVCNGTGICRGTTPPPCPADSETVGACGGFGDTCGETGTRLRTKTTYKYNCATAKCEASTIRTTESCTRNTAGVQCRGSANACDNTEYCSGGVCPDDGKAPAGSSCGSGMICTSSGDCVQERVPASCPSMTLNWSQDRPAWFGNLTTAGTYTCYGTVPAASHGASGVPARLINSKERTGSAQYTCNDGVWKVESSSCDGATIPTVVPTTCYAFWDDVRSKFLDWYSTDLKRCADTGGLDWWYKEYTTKTTCRFQNGFYWHYFDDKPSYALTEDGCWRDLFNKNAKRVLDIPLNNHISPVTEDNLCGSNAAYPWTWPYYGTRCKYRP